jgi:hypothetical protein
MVGTRQKALKWLSGRDFMFRINLMVTLQDPHLFRPDRRQLWNQIALKLEGSRGSIQLPLENIERWLQRGRLHPGPLLEWRDRLIKAQISDEAWADFLDFLRADNCDAQPLKSCSPFVGLLSREELNQLSPES